LSEFSTMPLFPLSAHIFPGGKMALRIFEARYLRMVKEAMRQEQGFVICMLNPKGSKDENTHIYPIGTYVEVVDFDMLDDGLLGLTVEGKHLLKIESITTEKDGLRTGVVSQFDQWQQVEPLMGQSGQLLGERLQQIIESYPELKALYPSAPVNDLTWVVYRWLELLPIKAFEKQDLIRQADAGQLLDFLEDLIK